MDEFEDKFEDELNPKFGEASFKDLDRLVYDDILVGLVDDPTDKKDPRTNFMVQLSGNCIRMITENLLTNNDRTILLQTADEERERIKYRNPVAYILGYIASGGGVLTLKHNKISDVAQRMDEYDPEGVVGIPGLIRYTRYWIMHKSKK